MSEDASRAEAVDVSPTNWEDTRVIQLNGIPGVGGGTAKNILDHFGTMRAVANARFDELLEIDGVGWDTARKVWNTYNVPWEGSPEEVVDDTENDIMNFLHLEYIGEEVKLEVYRETCELSSPPDHFDSVPDYIESKYRGEIPDAHVERMKEAL